MPEQAQVLRRGKRSRGGRKSEGAEPSPHASDITSLDAEPSPRASPEPPRASPASSALSIKPSPCASPDFPRGEHESREKSASETRLLGTAETQKSASSAHVRTGSLSHGSLSVGMSEQCRSRSLSLGSDHGSQVPPKRKDSPRQRPRRLTVVQRGDVDRRSRSRSPLRNMTSSGPPEANAEWDTHTLRLETSVDSEAIKYAETEWALIPQDTKRYEIHSLMGEGSFGKVYKGADRNTGAVVAIKAMKPQRLSFIKREVYILCILAGKPNIVQLTHMAIDWLTVVPFLIFEFVDHEDYHTLFPKLSVSGVMDYSYQLLTALHHCRCHSILHRDIKPANVVYNPGTRKLKLIDWGTAEIFLRGKDYTYRVGTRAFRAPELLAGCCCYDFSVDMWSFGCILWQAACGVKESMFVYGNDEVEMLKNITKVLGAEAFKHFFKLLSRERHRLGGSQATEILRVQPQQGSPFATTKDIARNPKLRACCDLGAFRLLDTILVFDPAARPVPAKAMEHEFFKTYCRNESAA